MDAIEPTLLTAQQPLNAFDKFVSVPVRIDPDLLELLVSHISQHIQGDLIQQVNTNQNEGSHGGLQAQPITTSDNNQSKESQIVEHVRHFEVRIKANHFKADLGSLLL